VKHVVRVAAVPERGANATGRRLLLVQDDQNLFGHRIGSSGRSSRFGYSSPKVLTGNFKASWG
jgi:hypothetical protein